MTVARGWLRPTVGRRIAVGFLVMAAVQMVLGGLGVWYTTSVAQSVDTGHATVARLQMIDDLEHRWIVVRAAVEETILNRRDSVVTRQVDVPLDAFRQTLERSVDPATVPSDDAEPVVTRDAAMLGAEAAAVVQQVASDARQGRWASARVLAHTDLASIDRRFQRSLDASREALEGDVRAATQITSNRSEKLLWYWTSTSALVALISGVVGFVTTRRITGPVNALVRDVRRVSAGDFAEVKASGQQDEIGLLSQSFAAMTTRLRHTYDDLVHRVEELWQSEERFRALVECAPDSILIVDTEDRVVLANGRAERLFGYPRSELLAMPLDRLVPRWRAAAISERVTESSAPRETQAVRRDGSTLPVEITTSRVETEHGALVTTILRDVTERKRFEEQLLYLAEHDALTGLLNRRRFERELGDHLARTARAACSGGAVLLLDLDNLKYVNDSLGHTVGDDLIKSVAGVLRTRLRATDVLARLGGDEFAVLLTGATAAQSALVAEDLLTALRGHIVAGGAARVQTTTSIGIAVIEDGSMTVGEVLIAADLAMYEAKESGRDKAAFFSPERREKAGEPLTWSTRIRQSLEQDGFELHLQPILDLRSRSVTHHEVLVRMSDADGAIAPAAFLPVAERFGLITAIDRWVVHRAVQCVADVRAAGRRIVLEVNLSGKSVTDRELLDYIAAEIARAEIEPEQLIFEITETAAIANMAEAARFAQDLTALGCRFALDDFGAGFASFYYLKHLPLSFVKLDGDFIRSLPTSPTDQLLVRAMVEVARGLGMQTIAEFVGDAETVELLTTLGVDFAQGFHVGMPEPAQAALRASVPVGAP